MIKKLKEQGINQILCVPDSILAPLIKDIQTDDYFTYHPMTREEVAVGVAAGMIMAREKVAILMQNSGLGNCLNALMSLIQCYELPLVIIYSHRGYKEDPIIAQKFMGNITTDLKFLIESQETSRQNVEFWHYE